MSTVGTKDFRNKPVDERLATSLPTYHVRVVPLSWTAGRDQLVLVAGVITYYILQRRPLAIDVGVIPPQIAVFRNSSVILLKNLYQLTFKSCI